MAELQIATGLSVAPIPPLSLLRARVRFARLIGLNSILVPDHLQIWIPSALWDPQLVWAATRAPSPHAMFEYQVLLGAIASSVGKPRLGVGVTEPIRRHPVLIAQAMLTLAHVAKRRPILGVGAGERENIDSYGFDFSEPVGRLEEALQILRLCFRGQGPIDFCGKYYHLERALLELHAPPGKVPEIWIAGRGPRMLQLIGQYGDGWYPAMIDSPDEYAAKLTVIRAAAQAAGRDPTAITPALYQWLLVAPTEQDARAMLETKALRYAHLLLSADVWRTAGVAHPFGEHFRGYVDLLPEQYDRPKLEEAIAAVPRELIGRFCFCGTAEQVVTQIRAFGAAGLRHVVLDPVWMSLLSGWATLYGFVATRRIARMLRSRR